MLVFNKEIANAKHRKSRFYFNKMKMDLEVIPILIEWKSLKG